MSRALHTRQTWNPSANASFDEVRRAFLKVGFGGALLAALPGCAAQGTKPVIGFAPIAPSTDDTVRVPDGYEAAVLYRWGDPVGSPRGMPQFRTDASDSADDQALQAGMHHDGMHYFPLQGSTHGLLAMNHEYVDQGLLFPDGIKTWSAEKVRKAQAAVGVSVIEVMLRNGRWELVRPSKNARRITAYTPCRMSGPAAGHALMRTAQNPDGMMVLGTFAGCAHGWTPWGTYLTCEENWHGYFTQRGKNTPDQARYGLSARGFGVRWDEHDERFDAQRHPNEPNRFGWVVEIDPFDPGAAPIKRTALGRFSHEGAACSVGADGQLAFYLGDDQAFEYIYKFVPSRRWDPANRANNRDLLDQGTLYAARFNPDGSGSWLPLVGRDQGEVLVRTRQAADAAGATKMDRPEWIMPHPVTREVYASLSNNSARRDPDAANPRAPNHFGHIVRWRENDDDVAATRFRWDVFVNAGPAGAGNITGDAFASPDGLWIDSMGTLWVSTDISPTALGKGPWAALGNNQLLAVDPATGVFRRFLTGPRGCEITGFNTTPDNRTAFVNIQHPGEGTPSTWPDHAPNARPRSATLAIRRKDGGIIGT